MWNSGLFRVCLVVLCLLAACVSDQPPVSEPPEPSTPVVTQVPVEEPAVPTTRVSETLYEETESSAPVTTQVFVGEEPVSTVVPTVDTLSESEEALIEELEESLTEAVMESLQDWFSMELHPYVTAWGKYVREPLVEYEDYPDAEQACEELLETLIAHHDLPGSPESHQAVLSSFRTVVFLDVLETGGGDEPLDESAILAAGDWSFVGDYNHSGGGTGPELHCVVKDNGSESWDAHLPGVLMVIFSEAHEVPMEDVDGKPLEGNWGMVTWTVGLDGILDETGPDVSG